MEDVEQKPRLGMSFLREKVSSLLGHTEVRYTENAKAVEGEKLFRIVATPWSVHIEGHSTAMTGMADLQAFAKAMSGAWEDHTKLKPKISKTLSGH